MKRHLYIILSVFLTINAMNGYAQKINVEDNEYTLDSKTLTATLSKGDKLISGNVIIPEEVTYNGQPYKVTAIGDKAFYKAEYLYMMELPETIESIGANSVGLCKSVKEINLPAGLKEIKPYAFRGCSALSNLTLPSGLTTIGEYAFENCYSFTEISLPESITTINTGILKGCKKLTSLTISSKTETIGGEAFFQCRIYELDLPKTITSIGDSAFFACNNITELVIGENVTTIGKIAFGGCTSLLSLYVEGGSTSLGEKAFYAIPDFTTSPSRIYVPDNRLEYYQTASGWKTYVDNIRAMSESSKTFEYSNLKFEITDNAAKTVKLVGYKIATGNFFIPQKVISGSNTYTVTSIGTHAFYNNHGVISVTVPEGITSIADNAFANCTNVESVSLPSTLETIGEGVLNGCIALKTITIPSKVRTIGSKAFKGCSSLATAELDCQVTVLPAYTFEECSKLQTATLPTNLVTIGNNTFFNCQLLQSITIPQTVATIGDYAFNKCAGLESIELPTTLNSLGASSFANCSKLETINVKAQSTSLGTSAFDGLPETFVINVAPARWKAYRSAENWSNYAEHIKAEGVTDETNLIDGLYYAITDFATPTVKLIGFETVSEDVVIPDVVTINNQEYKVTHIDANAFEGATELMRLIVPETIETISSTAFYGLDKTTVKIYVYEEKYATYCADNNWADYLDMLEVIATINNFTLNKIKYDVRGSDKKQVFIVGYESSLAGDLTLEPTVTYEKKTYQLTGIGSSAFENCTELNSITFTSNIATIEQGAFANCTGLTSITIPEKVTVVADEVFKGCSQLKNVTLHDKITEIGKYSFANCKYITELTIPENVTEIGEGAFYGCAKLKRANIPEAITIISDNMFNSCYNLDTVNFSKNVEAIGKSSFYNCQKLTVIDIPKNIKSIGETAFFGCESLKMVVNYSEECTLGAKAFHSISPNYWIYVPESKLDWYKKAENWISYSNFMKPLKDDGKSFLLNGIYYRITDFDNLYVQIFGYESLSTKLTVPEKVTFNDKEYTVTSIANNSFENCTIIQEITLPETIGYIGKEAFSNCTKLTTINIPEKITAILEKTFSGCKLLKGIKIPKSVTKIGEYAFANCETLKYADLPPNLEAINEGIFSGCHHLLNLVIPVNIESIAENAFSYCSTIHEIIFPEKVKTIKASAFVANLNLEEIEIPATLTQIENNSFVDCWILKTVIVKGDNTNIGENVFEGCDKINTIYVPADALEKYKSAPNWSKYKDIIKPLYLATVSTDYACTVDQKNNMILNNTINFTVEKGYNLQVLVNGEDWSENLEQEGDKYKLTIEDLSIVKTLQAITLMPQNSEGYYEIADEKQLYWFLEHISREGNQNQNAILVSDIVCNSNVVDRVDLNKNNELNQWYPNYYQGKYRTINRNSVFSGKFNGNGHSISGIYLCDTTLNNAGLFQTLKGTVENLAILDSHVEGKNNVGIICGVNQGNISNCLVIGRAKGESNIGGITGYAENGKIENCMYDGSVKGKSNLGTIAGTNKANISSVITYGTVAKTSSYGTICGVNSGTINNCRFYQELTTTPAVNGKNDSTNLVLPTTYLEAASKEFAEQFDETYWTPGSTESNSRMAQLDLPYLTTFGDTYKREFIVEIFAEGFTPSYFAGKEMNTKGFLVMIYLLNQKDTFNLNSPNVILTPPDMKTPGKATVYGRIYDHKFSFNITIIHDPTPVATIEHNAVNIWGYDGKIIIENADNKKITVYNVSGVKVKEVKNTTSRCEIPLAKNRVYLVEIGGKVTKIAL